MVRVGWTDRSAESPSGAVAAGVQAAAVPQKPALSVRNLRKDFGGVTAVADFSIDVAPGEIVSLLGSSGCGKTTALRCISGLEQLTGGEIEIAGKLVDSTRVHVPPHRRHVGLVFQSYALWPHMTVADNVRYGLDVLKVPREEALSRVNEVLVLVGLGELGHRLPSQLSGGQQQRVALARSLVVRPSLLLLDEPLSNLDAALRDRVRVELRTLLKRIGIASIYVTHDQREALSVADRVALMNNGHLLQEGPPEELYENPTSLFAADFLGRPNLLPIENVTNAGSSATADLSGVGRITGRIARPPLEGSALAMIRRERARLAGPGAAARGNTWRVLIIERLYEGATVEYTLKLGEHHLKVVTGDSTLAEGDEADLSVDPRDVVFLSRQDA